GSPIAARYPASEYPRAHIGTRESVRTMCPAFEAARGRHRRTTGAEIARTACGSRSRTPPSPPQSNHHFHLFARYGPASDPPFLTKDHAQVLRIRQLDIVPMLNRLARNFAHGHASQRPEEKLESCVVVPHSARIINRRKCGKL